MTYKLILERWSRYLNESEDSTLEAAKELLRKNTHLQKYADGLTPANLKEAGNYIFLSMPDTFTHTKSSHTRQSDLPGSKFNDEIINDESLTNLVVDFLKNADTPEVDSGPYGTKLKWFNVDYGKQIGLDSIVHKDDVKGSKSRIYDYREKIGNNSRLPAILSQGLTVVDAKGNEVKGITAENIPEGEFYIKQDVHVIDGPLRPTNKFNLIVADLGEINGKKLVSLVTTFPGVSEPKAMNKKDYADLGYYFLTGK
jgi:hypothetical protein